MEQIQEEAYGYAVRLARAETGLLFPDFPARCPYDLTDILERPFDPADLAED